MARKPGMSPALTKLSVYSKRHILIKWSLKYKYNHKSGKCNKENLLLWWGCVCLTLVWKVRLEVSPLKRWHFCWNLQVEWEVTWQWGGRCDRHMLSYVLRSCGRWRYSTVRIGKKARVSELEEQGQNILQWRARYIDKDCVIILMIILIDVLT